MLDASQTPVRRASDVAAYSHSRTILGLWRLRFGRLVYVHNSYAAFFIVSAIDI